jgi:hypothetical protein
MRQVGHGVGIGPGIFLCLSCAKVKFKVHGHDSTDLSLFSGFFGVDQDPRTLALAPVINWAASH